MNSGKKRKRREMARPKTEEKTKRVSPSAVKGVEPKRVLARKRYDRKTKGNLDKSASKKTRKRPP